MEMLGCEQALGHPPEKQGWWVAQLSRPAPLWSQGKEQPWHHSSPHQLSLMGHQGQLQGLGSLLGQDNRHQCWPIAPFVALQAGLLPEDICLCSL